MATSTEKLAALRATLEGPPGPEATPDELALRTAINMGRPVIERFLPEAPEDLDMFLAGFRETLRRLMSDPQPAEVAELDRDFALELLDTVLSELEGPPDYARLVTFAKLERERLLENVPAELEPDAAAAIAAELPPGAELPQEGGAAIAGADRPPTHEGGPGTGAGPAN